MGELDHQMSTFTTSVRAGRRNALPDLGLENLDPGAYKLAEQMASMMSTPAAGGDARQPQEPGTSANSSSSSSSSQSSSSESAANQSSTDKQSGQNSGG